MRKAIRFWRRISLSNRSASRMSKGTEQLNQSVYRIQLQMNTFHLAGGREFGEIEGRTKK